MLYTKKAALSTSILHLNIPNSSSLKCTPWHKRSFGYKLLGYFLWVITIERKKQNHESDCFMGDDEASFSFHLVGCFCCFSWLNLVLTVTLVLKNDLNIFHLITCHNSKKWVLYPWLACLLIKLLLEKLLFNFKFSAAKACQSSS